MRGGCLLAQVAPKDVPVLARWTLQVVEYQEKRAVWLRGLTPNVRKAVIRRDGPASSILSAALSPRREDSSLMPTPRRERMLADLA